MARLVQSVADTAYPVVLVDRTQDGVTHVVVSRGMPTCLAAAAVVALLTPEERSEVRRGLGLPPVVPASPADTAGLPPVMGEWWVVAA